MGLTKARSGQDNYPPLGKFARQWNFISFGYGPDSEEFFKKNTLKIKRNIYLFCFWDILLITAIPLF